VQLLAAYRRCGGASIWADEHEKREEKTEKEDKERKEVRDNNNCLPSLLMPLWFYRLFR